MTIVDDDNTTIKRDKKQWVVSNDKLLYTRRTGTLNLVDNAFLLLVLTKYITISINQIR